MAVSTPRCKSKSVEAIQESGRARRSTRFSENARTAEQWQQPFSVRQEPADGIDEFGHG